MKNTIKTVAITGGTHGNELTGVHFVQHWQQNPDAIQRGSFATELHLANPEANQQMRRYIDQDLNRQFSLHDLNNAALSGCEHRSAKVLNQQLGPKEDPRVDFVIDLHTTTANMGMSLIFNAHDPLVVGMAFYIKRRMPDANLFFNPSEGRLEDNFLTSMGRLNGFLIEVGPIAQSLLNYEVYVATEAAVQHGLDYLQLINRGQSPELPGQMSGFQFLKKVPLPQNEQGEIVAMVHPDRQNKDYQRIDKGSPLFITLGGEVINYEGDAEVYGAFINEAAYYDQKIGLSFMEKINITLND